MKLSDIWLIDTALQASSLEIDPKSIHFEDFELVIEAPSNQKEYEIVLKQYVDQNGLCFQAFCSLYLNIKRLVQEIQMIESAVTIVEEAIKESK